MWPVHLFFANAKVNAHVARIASTRKEEKGKKEREKKRNGMEASNIVSAHKSIAIRIISAREFARLITKIDFIVLSGRIEINIFNCVCERRLTVPPNVLWRDFSAITAVDRFKCTGRRSLGLILSFWRNFSQLIKNLCVLSNYIKQLFIPWLQVFNCLNTFCLRKIKIY